MIELNDLNFEKEIQNAKLPVLVDFFAEWCNPCSVLSPILEKIEKDFEGKIILAKINLDSSPLVSQKFAIDQIPTVLFFKENKPVSGFVGLLPELAIKQWLENTLKDNGGEEKQTEEIIKEYEDYVKQNNFQLNLDREVVKRIIKGLLANEKKYGNRYCPCRRVTGNLEEDKPKICPCQWHKEEIEKNGHCLCRLFAK